MTHTVIVQPEAEADIAEAFAWYNARETGIGHAFVAELDRLFARIIDRPEIAPFVHRHVRRLSLLRFPYVVVFVERDDVIYILGVLHQRRDPKLLCTRATSFKP
jgi:plasmid stabilization system protein ParE